jgi:hypothetical protein
MWRSFIEWASGKARRVYLIADEADAEAILIAYWRCRRGRRRRWPGLDLRNIDEDDLAALWQVLPGEGDRRSILGDEVVDGSDEFPGPNVCRVRPEFISALAALTAADWRVYPAQVQQSGKVSHATRAQLVSCIWALSEFARRAQAAGKPVLQYSEP